MKFVILSLLLVFAAAKDPPKWESLYTVKGVLYIPYAEIEEPFYGWYDKVNGRSRIDYYGGMVKTYQLRNAFKYGTSLKFAPVSTDEYLNRDTCLQVNGTTNYSIGVQSILPDVKNFSLIGTVDYNGQVLNISLLFPSFSCLSKTYNSQLFFFPRCFMFHLSEVR